LARPRDSDSEKGLGLSTSLTLVSLVPSGIKDFIKGTMDVQGSPHVVGSQIKKEQFWKRKIIVDIVKSKIRSERYFRGSSTVF